MAALHRVARDIARGGQEQGDAALAGVYVVAPGTVDIRRAVADAADHGTFVRAPGGWWPHLSMEHPPQSWRSWVANATATSLLLWQYAPADVP